MFIRKFIVGFLFALLIFAEVAYSQKEKLLSDEEIQQWLVSHDRFATEYINHAQSIISSNDTMGLLSPIIINRIQLDYDFSELENDDVYKAERLALRAIYNTFFRKMTIKYIDTEKNDSIKLVSSIQSLMMQFKNDNISNARLEDFKIISPYKYVIIPYLEWIRTIEHFDPKQSRSSMIGAISFTENSYTWSMAKAAIFVLNTANNEVVYYNYHFNLNGAPIRVDENRIDRIFRKCAKPLLREIR